MSSIDFLVGIIHESIQDAKINKDRYSEYNSVVLCKDLNRRILSDIESPLCVEYVKTHMLQLTSMFLWTTRCCQEPSVVAETYNGMHMTGILFFKCVYLILRGEFEQTKLVNVFPGMTGLVVSDVKISEMPYKVLSTAVIALQHEWKALVLSSNRKRGLCGLLLCISRFAYFLLHLLPSTLLDDLEHREASQANHQLFRPNNRCVRSVVTTCMIMMRSHALVCNATSIRLNAIKADNSIDDIIKLSSCTNTPDVYKNVNENTVRVLNRISRTRKLEKSEKSNLNKIDIESVWNFIGAKITLDKMGDMPVKFTATLEDVLKTAYVCLSEKDEDCVRTSVSQESTMLLECAIKFFYVIPSVDKFREVRYVESILPGQRLNYSFDYQYFDSGQLSQVVYMYNPLYKTTRPPNTPNDWDKRSVAGPVAAFCHFVPELEVHMEDSEDPLGVLNLDRYILRPSDYHKVDSDQNRPIKIDWRLVVNNVGAFLINTKTTEIFTSYDVDESGGSTHPTLLLLAYFMKRAGYTNQVVAVAINAIKICT